MIDVANCIVLEMPLHDVTLLTHLVDVLTFFVHQHLYRCRNFMHSESLATRIAHLLKVPQKHLKLSKSAAGILSFLTS